MSPLNKILATKRIKDLEQYLTELNPYLAVGLEKYLKDREKRYVVERLIQLIVEVASDWRCAWLLARGCGIALYTVTKTLTTKLFTILLLI
ncbi:MAG: hypothetical protein Fur002_25780 [Anaerolineales bacterium]